MLTSGQSGPRWNTDSSELIPWKNTYRDLNAWQYRSPYVWVVLCTKKVTDKSHVMRALYKYIKYYIL